MKANDFLIIQRIKKKINKKEAAFLCKLENCTTENIELYINTLMAGPSEIIITSKVGAVQDAYTIVSGSKTGRKRANQTGDEGGGRSNVDSLSAMFEIAPFSSFNEFLDLEDFFVNHSRLSKYKKHGSLGKNFDPLFVQVKEEVRMELSSFQRSFNMAAFAASTETDALSLMRLLAPKSA